MINIGIYGYGNLGRGIELAVRNNPDIRISAVFTRRDPSTVHILTEGVPVEHISKAVEYKDVIDVMILCGGSKNDLPVQSPELAEQFNIVDSFDTHAKIPVHFAAVDKAAKEGGRLALISAGWDPGMFSLMRVYAEAILPKGETATFWGKGVSQGHSDAIRRIEGVLDARQYTIPKDEALALVRETGSVPKTAREKHLRECYVVLKDGADREKVRSEIVNMPDYFADYDTVVHFISREELIKDHSGMPHGGLVIRAGKTSDDASHTVEYSLKLDSNPEFTSSVLVAFARAVKRMADEGKTGCITVYDVAPKYLLNKTYEDLIGTML